MSSGRPGLLDPQSSETRVSVAEADPDILRGLDEAAADEARIAAVADVISFQPGAWEPSLEAARALYGLFIIDGLISRGVVIEGRRAAELLGPGDVLRRTRARRWRRR